MSGQGYHLALDEDQVRQLLSCSNELEILEYVDQVLREFWIEEGTTHIEGDYKDWDVLLLCFTDGTYDPRGGTYPLNKCFFGGHLLVQDGSIVNLVMSGEVRDLAEALDKIDIEDFRERYVRLLPDKSFDHVDDGGKDKDKEYMYEMFFKLNGLKELHRRAAQEGRAVMFYTDDPLGCFFKPSTEH